MNTTNCFNNILKALQKLEETNIPPYKIVLDSDYNSLGNLILGILVVYIKNLPSMVLSDAQYGKWIPIFPDHVYDIDIEESERLQSWLMKAYERRKESPENVRNCKNYPHLLHTLIPVYEENSSNDTLLASTFVCPEGCGFEYSFRCSESTNY